VNNAAFSEAVPFILIDDDEFADLLELNLFAPFRMCRAAVRGMIRQKFGRIVNISSITGSRSATRNVIWMPARFRAWAIPMNVAKPWCGWVHVATRT
jgi:NAD(P)-dependent dehydrogenase (short-subunit alcohol dehydrogenase family)